MFIASLTTAVAFTASALSPLLAICNFSDKDVDVASLMRVEGMTKSALIE
jgi:hypothetical protein